MLGELHKLPVSNQLALELFKFLGGFSLNLFIGGTLQASTGKTLPDLITNATAKQILKMSESVTPYINAEAGRAINERLAKESAIKRELLTHRFKIARDEGAIDLSDKQIEELIDKKIPKAQDLIIEASNTGKFLDAAGLAKKIDGLSEDAARVLLDENSKAKNVWLFVENSNITGIMLAGATTVLPIPLPANPFFAQLIRGGLGYTVAYATKKAVPAMRRKFGEWWSNTSEKDSGEETERRKLLSKEKARENDDDLSLHGGSSAEVSEDEGESQPQSKYGSVNP